ncbi:MAG: transposase, partial [Proteobacteria bacterium]|nr:transposase [Pseudomonadota bacterium]
GAAWHKGTHLVVPANIEIMILPPYCPELNPVEKLWQFLKNRTIKNKIFSTLEELEQTLIETLNALTRQLIASICRTSYLLF